MVIYWYRFEFFFYKCFYFHSTSGRTYQLQAKDKQTMMFWLQELQVLAAAILIVWSDA